MIATTKLINLLDKPFLKYWANKIGLQGINIRDYEKKVQNDGNVKHSDIEKYIKEGTPFNGCEIFEESISNYEIIGCESEVNNGKIVGRVDLILKRNDEIYVVDFKRSKNIYLSTKLQLSTYKEILKADYIAFMNLENFQLEIINIDTIKYFTIVKRLYQINELLIELKE